MVMFMSILDLFVFLVLDKDDLGVNGCLKEIKKFDVFIIDNFFLEYYFKNVGEGI